MDDICMETISLIINGLLLMGIVVGVFQVRAAIRVSRANVLLRLLEEWNSRELYKAIRFIHGLRKEWREIELNETLWPELAKQWVAERVNADLDSTDLSEKKLAEEWFQRRLVAQFISRIGGLLKSKYISEDAFFTLVPEVQRLIIVLEPIDNAIIEHYKTTENATTQKKWDRPMRKTAYQYIRDRHEKWFKKHDKEF
jgi:hypothetical protein